MPRNGCTFALLFRDACGRGEIGRRTRLRIWRREAWGFESLRPHFFIQSDFYFRPMPTISRHDLDSTTAHLTVTILREEIQAKLDNELKRFRQRASIKGFRQGQAPMQYVKNMYGSSILYDLFNNMMNDEVLGYLQEQNLNALGQPLPVENQTQRYTLKVNNLEPEYSITYEVGHVPAWELKGLDKSNEMTFFTVSNLDDLAEKELAEVAKNQTERIEAEDNIQPDDLVTISEAKEMEGDAPKADGLTVKLSFLVNRISDETFKTDILGYKKGDTIRLNPRHTDTLNEEKLYRRYVLALEDSDTREVTDSFEGVIDGVSRVTKAEINEDFFKNSFGVDSKEAALDQLKPLIENYYRQRAEGILMRDLQAKLLELNAIELPVEFLKRWIKVTNTKELNDETIEAELPVFLADLRWSMIRDRVNDQFDVFVTDEDIREHFRQRIRGYFQQYGSMGSDDFLENFINRMMTDKKGVKEATNELEYQKMFEAMRDNVTLVNKPITSDELTDMLNAAMKKTEMERRNGNLLD
jgi:trigger factor